MTKDKRTKQAKRQKAATKRGRQSKKRALKPRIVTSVATGVKPHVISKPDSFAGFEEIVNHARTNVYQISRLRQDGQQVHYRSLGSGFLVAPNRLMTCAHCIDNTQAPADPMLHHMDGDAYILVQRDEQAAYHVATVVPRKGRELFYYHDTDCAILHLPDDFYKVNGAYFKNSENHLRLCDQPRNIGARVCVLGYPLQGLVIQPNGSPDIGGIYMRGDVGVVNTRHYTSGRFMYEFTIPFNPGNSGGPILDGVTGDVVGMVHAYNSIPINATEDTVTKQNDDGTSVTTVHTSIIRTTYSLGLASENFKQYKAKHGIVFDN